MPSILQNKKILIVVGVVVFLLLALIAVSALSPKQKVAIPTTDTTPVSLTWWSFYDQSVYADILADFQKLPGNQNVKITVVKQTYDNDYYKSFIADIASNAGPDIFSLRNDDLASYKRYMTPINVFQGAVLASYKNSFVPLVVRDTMFTDQVYAVTSWVDNLQLYYNPNLLSQSGIALPAKTWSEVDKQLGVLNKRDTTGINFIRSAISLGTGGQSKDGRGGNIDHFTDIIPTLIFQNGGQLYDYQKNTSIFGQTKDTTDMSGGSTTNQTFDNTTQDNNPTYKALKFYKDFGDVDTSRYSWNNSSRDNVDNFVDGKLAYIINYSSFKNTLSARNSRFQYGISELPQLDLNYKKTYGYFFMDGINKQLATDVENNPKDLTKLKKQQKAEEFLYFLSQKESQTKLAATLKMPAARRDVIQEQLNGADNIRVFAAGSLYADNYYKPDVVRSEKIWSDLMYRVQYENKPLPDSLNQAISEYKFILQSGPKLRG